MKKFIQKVQDLTQKAEQIKQAVKNAPAQVAELRETVAAAASQFQQQFQQIRQDVQSGVADLKVVTDDKMAEALREIDETTDVFRRAGYAIDGVDIEFGLTPKLLVHMDKVDEVPAQVVRALIAGHEQKKICGSILSSLVRAEEIEDKIKLANLGYREVTVEVGLLPCVRLCWRPTSAHPSANARLAGVPSLPQPVATSSTAPPFTATSPAPHPYGQSSFFEQRAAPPPAVKASETPALETASAASEPSSPPKAIPTPPPPPSEPPKKARWGHESLDRFKKMPDLSK